VVFATIADGGSFPLLLLFAPLLEGCGFWLKKADLFIFICIGFSVYGNQILYVTGVYLTNPNIGTIFMLSVPAITSFFATIFRMEVLEWRSIRGWAKISGIFIVIGGALVMVLSGGDNSFENPIFGFICLFGSCLCSSMVNLLISRFLYDKRNGQICEKYPPIHATAWIFGFATMFMILTCIYWLVTDRSVFVLSYQATYPILYAVLISCVLCYTLNVWALKKTSSTVVTAFGPLQVLISVILSFIFFRIVPYWQDYVGAVLITLGLFLVCWSKYREEQISTQYQPINSENTEENSN